MKKMILVIVLLLLTTLLFGCGTMQKKPSDNVPPDESSVLIGYEELGNIFAFANEQGDRLITFTPISNARDIENSNLAIGENGQYYTIEFIKKQDRNGQDSGRAMASNFDNMEGYIYGVLEKEAVPNQTYFISSKELISQQDIQESKLAQSQPLSIEEKAAVSNAKGKSVQEGWIIANVGAGIQLQVVVFESEGQNYLMNMVMKTADGSLKFMDYPAVSEGQSVWRVDDGGNIDPSLFSILFAIPTDKGFLFAVSWAAGEGENTLFLLEQPDKLQEQPETAYRYWSPA